MEPSVIPSVILWYCHAKFHITVFLLREKSYLTKRLNLLFHLESFEWVDDIYLHILESYKWLCPIEIRSTYIYTYRNDLNVSLEYKKKKYKSLKTCFSSGTLNLILNVIRDGGKVFLLLQPILFSIVKIYLNIPFNSMLQCQLLWNLPFL